MTSKLLAGAALAGALALVLVAGLASAQTPLATPLGTSFTYQGRLNSGGTPYDGTCDLQFDLWDALESGSQVGTQTKTGVELSEGYFTVQLYFGSGAFNGDERWLGISVCCPTGSCSYEPLSPRQALTAVPYALYAERAGDAWSLSGNSGTIAGVNYLGTNDYRTLELWADGKPILRLEPSVDGGPNLIGGHSLNRHGNGVHGATIGGGGGPLSNRVLDHYGTVGGGMNNQAGRTAGTLGETEYAAVGGGSGNTASGEAASVGGGSGNIASGEAASVGGGWFNTAGPGIGATVPGGYANTATGEYSFAAGRFAHALHDGSFVWADSTIADFSSTASDQFAVRASHGVKIVREATTFSSTSAALQVDYGGAAEAAWFYNTSTGNDSAVLRVLKQPATSGADANFIEGLEYTGSGGATGMFHIDKNGTYTAGSDFAEALAVVGDPADYEPGDVLVISLDRPGEVEKCCQAYDGRVLGVYSTRPGFLGADEDGLTEVLAGEVPVAVLGIVAVKVSAENGPIQPGDLLTTSSTPGHAMRCEGLERCFGRTLGKALEGLSGGQNTGVIQMLVTLQ